MISNIVYATNTVFIADEWKAGTYQKIRVETEINYDISRIIIKDSAKNILFNSSMNKKDTGVFDIIYYIPSNAKADLYQITVILDRNYYPEFNKTMEVKIIELNFIDKLILLIKTHIPFFK